MPAPVRTACRPTRLTRPTTSLGPALTPALHQRHRARWSSSWDPDHWRHHRALWQRYSRLTGDAWGPQWGARHSFPPLMREMEAFEKWARELEAEMASGQKGGGKVRMSWSESCKGFAPSKRWGYHAARFQHTGRDGGRQGDSSAPEPRRDNPVEPKKEGSSAFQQEKVWSPNQPEPSDYYIDPVTNRKVARSEKAKDDVASKTDEPIELGAPAADNKEVQPGAGAQAKDDVVHKSDKPIELGSPAVNKKDVMSGAGAEAKEDVVPKTDESIELGPPATDAKGAVEPEAEKHFDAAKPIEHQPAGRHYPYARDQDERESSTYQSRNSPSVGPTRKKKKGMKSIESSKPQERTEQPSGVAENQEGPHTTGTRTLNGRCGVPRHGQDFSQDLTGAWANSHNSRAVSEDGSSASSPARKRGGLYPTGTGTSSGKGRMTGNYVQDFPEDFAESWAGRYRSEQSFNDEGSSRPLEPALNRTKAQESGDKLATQPETAEPRTKHDELVKELREIYEQSYGAIEELPDHSSSSESKSLDKALSQETAEKTPRDPDVETEPKQTLYKILVYDPQEQKISTAVATSTVPDDVEVLTPAEAVTQLSNPAKFLPHFGPLQAQGYEVVSSDHNVLVFRKMREATEPGTVFLRGAGYTPPGPRRVAPTPAVNPIDMMGSESVVPNIGNFASPTGYANYGELETGPAVPKRKPPPPFRAASDVDYEGEDASSREEGKGPGLLWRTTVGAAWMAGLVYGGSVINEYFRTGGEGGEGPRGAF